MKKWIGATMLAAASVCAGPAVAQIGAAKVTGGEVQGVVTNGVASFKGIPFAAAPIGPNRWRSPQPVTAWTGVRKADAIAPACLQDTGIAKLVGAPTAVSEDCLYLNVWSAARTPDEKRPVMVWIYGGAFSAGATNWPMYDGRRLAEKGVVLVSVAYRVGPFGFLAHPQLSRESGKGSGNYGLEDQIASLRWVKNNIARFGGDPARVTIFGESAGGIAVSMLAASPAAKGLFQRAISESGGSFAPARTGSEGGQNVLTQALAEESGRKFFATLGVSDVQAARALPAAKIEGALRGNDGFWPTLDGHIIVGDQYVLYQAGKFNDTPVLIGTNSDEGAMFTPPAVKTADYEKQVRAGYGDKAGVILAANPHATDAEAHRAAKNLFRDSVFAWPTWAWATLQSQQGKGRAFVYYFDHRDAMSPDGATHGSEITYVFRNLANPVAPPTDDDRSLSELMSSYWVNFATNGDPNGPGLPRWPAFSSSAQKVMHLSNASGAPDQVQNLPQLQALDQYYAWRREQAKKSD